VSACTYMCGLLVNDRMRDTECILFLRFKGRIVRAYALKNT